MYSSHEYFISVGNNQSRLILIYGTLFIVHEFVKMCCKCPPLPTGSLYIILNIIFGIFFYMSTGIYITGPADIQIVSISKCPGFEDRDVHLQLKVDRSLQTISGNISLETEFDHLVKLNSKDQYIMLFKKDNCRYSFYKVLIGTFFVDKSNLKYPKSAVRSFINETDFYKIIDNYLGRDQDFDSAKSRSEESVCQVSRGIYMVQTATVRFTIEFLPYDMLRTKLLRNDKLLICRELEVVAHLEYI